MDELDGMEGDVVSIHAPVQGATVPPSNPCHA